MLVTCEKCHTKYKLSNSEVKKIKTRGRVLKCGNCHHLWLLKYEFGNFKNNLKTHNPFDQELIKEIKSSKEESLLLREIVSNRKISDYFNYYHFSFYLKIILYILLFSSLLTFIVTKKNKLIKIPILNNIVKIVGLKDSYGLSFRKIEVGAISSSKNAPLLINGYVVNSTNIKKQIPDFRIKFLDKNKEVLEIYSFVLPVKYLEPKEELKIANKIKIYPEHSFYLELEIGDNLEFFYR